MTIPKNCMTMGGTSVFSGARGIPNRVAIDSKVCKSTEQTEESGGANAKEIVEM